MTVRTRFSPGAEVPAAVFTFMPESGVKRLPTFFSCGVKMRMTRTLSRKVTLSVTGVDDDEGDWR